MVANRAGSPNRKLSTAGFQASRAVSEEKGDFPGIPTLTCT